MASASGAVSTPSQTYLSKELDTTDLEKLDNILANVKTRITFWGKRIIVPQTSDMKGSYSLNAFARDIINLANARCQKDDLTTEERLKGITISLRIKGLYYDSDQRVKQRNFLTRFFVFLSELSFKPYTTRCNAEKNRIIEKYFSAYSIDKHKDTFGDKKKRDNKYRFEKGQLDSPRRIIVSEGGIRLAHMGELKI